MLKLFDTAQGQVVPFEPREPGKVSMYVCGPTVYGPPHLGHGRFSLVFDVLRRYLEWTGQDVHYVSNITDIDDKIIQRGLDEGKDPAKIAVKCESIWYRAMDAIGVKRPDDDPHATAYVEEMVGYITDLMERGCRLRDIGRRVFQPGIGCRLRTTRSPGHRLPSLRCAGRGHRREAHTDRLRDVEEGQAGRAHLGFALGSGVDRAGIPSVS